MSAITTHVLDTARGRPASSLPVTLEVQLADGRWKLLGHGPTDADGRARNLLPEGTPDRKSTRLNSSHIQKSRMPSSA